MKIIVDTCILSLALKRNIVTEHPCIEELRNLIEEVRVQLISSLFTPLSYMYQGRSLSQRLSVFYKIHCSVSCKYKHNGAETGHLSTT